MLFGLALFAACGPAAAQGAVLRIGGTGAATELMKRLGAAFETYEAGVEVEVIPGLGSSGAISATMDGALDIAVSARPLKQAEAEAGLTGSPFARTPYGMVSSHPRPGDIAAADLAAFFASVTSTWPDGTPVRVILRPLSESDTALLGETFPGMAEAIHDVRARPDVSVAATDQDNLDMAADVEGSLVGTSLAQVVTEGRRLQFMSIDGVAPSVESVEAGQYPYVKLFHMIVAGAPAPLAERFIAFIRSDEGVAILREAACLPIMN
ncbi:substrate-binding domain-containing protein [Hoeflea sp. BAL378]|uniref:substrate-binding domain-containing protein n=1 Tax=Hoeflea sp. BAL378 TaxID=1547437 RepID=UPI000A8DA38F|nr:substrate-binding domain-containing protein [Hoeflea sp. BAL378]